MMTTASPITDHRSPIPNPQSLIYNPREGAFLVEPTVRLGPEEQLGRLSRMAEDIRAQLASFRASVRGSGPAFPSGLVEALRQLSGSLLGLRATVEQIEQERRSLLALAEIGQVVNSSLDLSVVLNEVIDTIIRLTGAQRAFLMLRNGSGQLDVVVARNWERASLSADEREISRTLVDRVTRSGEPVLTTNAQADPRFDGQQSVVAYNLRSILAVPLKVKGELTGVIYADNRAKEGLFSERERNLLTAFANQAAVALENARLFASVRGTLDEVTELKNLMEDVFASIDSGVLTADIRDQITLCNRAAGDILGRARSQLLGASLTDLLQSLSPELPSIVEEIKNEDRRVAAFEVRPTLEERGAVDLSLSLAPLKTADQTTRGVTIVLDDRTETRRLEAQRRLFERMVSPAVIDQLNPDRIQLGGSLTEITTLFADIRGFTRLAEVTDPATLVGILNRYLAAAAEAILQEEGTIDKFLGDAVMAWFNAPMPQADHRLRAARAALAIQRASAQLHAELPPTFHLRFGIGLHTGSALLGLIGTERRVEYTAIGDSVNTARRLQEHAAEAQILISREAAAPIEANLEVVPHPPIQAEGKQAPIEVFELVGLKAP
jgi:PAS domain S-box-containing protein